MTDPDRLARFTESLITLKQDLEAQEAGTAQDRAPVELDQSRMGRLSRMDALQAQAVQAAVSDRRRQAIRRIEAALQRMDEGEFGYCLSCGEPIDLKRLELDPAAPHCARCAGGPCR